MSKKKPEATATFAAHYATLQDSVQKLRTLDIADLDALVGLVDKASAAYKGCQERLGSIQALLGQSSQAPAAPSDPSNAGE